MMLSAKCFPVVDQCDGNVDVLHVNIIIKENEMVTMTTVYIVRNDNIPLYQATNSRAFIIPEAT